MIFAGVAPSLFHILVGSRSSIQFCLSTHIYFNKMEFYKIILVLTVCVFVFVELESVSKYECFRDCSSNVKSTTIRMTCYGSDVINIIDATYVRPICCRSCCDTAYIEYEFYCESKLKLYHKGTFQRIQSACNNRNDCTFTDDPPNVSHACVDLGDDTCTVGDCPAYHLLITFNCSSALMTPGIADNAHSSNSSSKADAKSTLVGLAVGIPLMIILFTAVIVIAVNCYRKKRNTSPTTTVLPPAHGEVMKETEPEYNTISEIRHSGNTFQGPPEQCDTKEVSRTAEHVAAEEDGYLVSTCCNSSLNN